VQLWQRFSHFEQLFLSMDIRVLHHKVGFSPPRWMIPLFILFPCLWFIYVLSYWFHLVPGHAPFTFLTKVDLFFRLQSKLMPTSSMNHHVINISQYITNTQMIPIYQTCNVNIKLAAITRGAHQILDMGKIGPPLNVFNKNSLELLKIMIDLYAFWIMQAAST